MVSMTSVDFEVEVVLDPRGASDFERGRGGLELSKGLEQRGTPGNYQGAHVSEAGILTHDRQMTTISTQS